MIVFRRLQRGDLAFLLEVRNQSRDMLHDNSVVTLEQAQVWFDTQQPRFYLATQDAKPVGYFRTSNWDEANSHAYVGFDLHPDFRGKGLAQSVELFDVYAGATLEPGVRSLAYHVVLQAAARTLTDEDVQKFLSRAERAVTELGATVRKA